MLDKKARAEILNINMETFVTSRKPDIFFWNVPECFFSEAICPETIAPKSGTEIKCSFTDKNLNTKKKRSGMRRAVKVIKWLFRDSLVELNHKSRTAKRLEKYTGCPYKEQVFYFSDFSGNGEELSTFLF